LIDLVKEERATNSSDRSHFLMRHSQGDQWDILALYPLGSYQGFFKTPGHDKFFREKQDALISFREDLFAFGPPLEIIKEKFSRNNFYHIEMFNAVAGKQAELLHQRKIENIFLESIEINANSIWIGDYGSDVDSFTIGFYPSLQAYATPNKVSDKEANELAIKTGLEGRAFIGTYLRGLIFSHQDTLAVAIPE
jgi:hypothetical protein